jgi:hypothetical protein
MGVPGFVCIDTLTSILLVMIRPIGCVIDTCLACRIWGDGVEKGDPSGEMGAIDIIDICDLCDLSDASSSSSSAMLAVVYESYEM